MKIDFSYQWFVDTCNEAGWNPNNVLSQSAIAVARKCSVLMKKFMDAKKNYPEEDVQRMLDTEIKKWNEQRIEFMLNALFYAEIMDGLGQGANEFFERVTR